jgi:phage shock protein A
VKQLLQYWPLLAFGGNALCLWIAWSLRQLANKEIDAKVAKANARVDAANAAVLELERRVAKAEGKIETMREDILNMPTRADLERVAGEVRSVGDQVKAAASGIDRIEGFFIRRGVEQS